MRVKSYTGGPGRFPLYNLCMQYLASLLHNPVRFFRNNFKQSALLPSGFIFLILYALVSAARNAANPSQVTIYTDRSTVTMTLARPTTTSTKWWIKTKATTPAATITASTALDEPKASSCSKVSSSPLRTQTFAYIALTPNLPNRIRSDASLSREYVGQIEPGSGLRVLAGPVCADGYPWWLVETLDKRLRGWTVEGKDPEQWIIPCINVSVPCNFLPTPTPSRIPPKDDHQNVLQQNSCRSDKLAIGMLAHVDRDSLIVIRAEPSVGAIIGHAGPMSTVKVLEGPNCLDSTIWWMVNAPDLGLSGWTTENYLEACPQGSQCGE